MANDVKDVVDQIKASAIKNPTDRLVFVADKVDGWITTESLDHERRMIAAIRQLEKDIVDRAADFVTKGGKLLGPQANLKLAQKLHRDLTSLFDKTYGSAARGVTTGLDRALDLIDEEIKVWGSAPSFTGVDADMIKTLKSSAWGTFKQLGDATREQLIDTMYAAVAARVKFSDLVDQFRASLSGETDRAGRPLANYAKTFVNDAVNTFHNEVHMMKAKKLGINNFMYYGNAMLTTRPFCRERIGQVFSADEINSWTFSWKGKSGPAMTNRGGYNCRHRWLAVKVSEIDQDELKSKFAPEPTKEEKKVKKALKPTKEVTAKTSEQLKKEWKTQQSTLKKMTKGTGLGSWKYASKFTSEETAINIFGGNVDEGRKAYRIFLQHERALTARATYINSLPPKEAVLERKAVLANMLGNKKQQAELKAMLLQKYPNSPTAYDAFVGQLQKGTNYMSNRLLLQLERSGLKIRVSDKPSTKFRAFYSFKDKSVNIAYNDAHYVVAHEFGHSVDSLLSSGGGNFEVCGLSWSSTGPCAQPAYRDTLRRMYDKAKSGGLGTYKNGDGQYFLGNWMDDYEGRIYAEIKHNGLRIQGSEFWAMNTQRYADVVRSARRKYVSALSDVDRMLQRMKDQLASVNALPAPNKTLVEKFERNIKVLTSNREAITYDYYLAEEKRFNTVWNQMEDHYPGLHDVIEGIYEKELV